MGVTFGNGTFLAVGPNGAIYQTPDMRPRFDLQPASPGTGTNRFVLRGYSNALYAVEISTNLLNWERRWTNRITAAGVDLVDEAQSRPASYYRAVLIPE